MIKFLDLGNGICVNAEYITCVVRRSEEPLVLTIHLINGQKIEAEGPDALDIETALHRIGLPNRDKTVHHGVTTKLI